MGVEKNTPNTGSTRGGREKEAEGRKKEGKKEKKRNWLFILPSLSYLINGEYRKTLVSSHPFQWIHFALSRFGDVGFFRNHVFDYV